MINTTIKHSLHIAFIICFFSCNHAFASAYDATASVLRFQTKMAERGVAESQYKLGFMHEIGSGVEHSLSTALHWYKKASIQGYQPASNRIVYLQIKNTGMKQQHNHWLSKLKSNAQAGDKDALFLLGQMYAEGTGVNKSLTHSLELLRKAARKNLPDAEPHIIRVERELAALQEKYSHTEIDKYVQNPSPVTPSIISKVASKKAVTSANLKNVKKVKKVKKVSRITKAQVKQQPRPIKKDPLKAENKTKITHKTNPDSQPVKKQLSDKAAPSIAAASESSEVEYRHPMDMICSGSNRLMSGCR